METLDKGFASGVAEEETIALEESMQEGFGGKASSISESVSEKDSQKDETRVSVSEVSGASESASLVVETRVLGDGGSGVSEPGLQKEEDSVSGEGVSLPESIKVAGEGVSSVSSVELHGGEAKVSEMAISGVSEPVSLKGDTTVLEVVVTRVSEREAENGETRVLTEDASVLKGATEALVEDISRVSERDGVGVLETVKECLSGAVATLSDATGSQVIQVQKETLEIVKEVKVVIADTDSSAEPVKSIEEKQPVLEIDVREDTPKDLYNNNVAQVGSGEVTEAEANQQFKEQNNGNEEENGVSSMEEDKPNPKTTGAEVVDAHHGAGVNEPGKTVQDSEKKLGTQDEVPLSEGKHDLIEGVEGQRDLIPDDDSNAEVVEEDDEQEGDEEPSQSNQFSVGDFVWGKIKCHPWWPGQVYDPPDASELANKMRRKGRHLVAYFGDGTFAWCDESQLKPFDSYFETFSMQTNMNRFVNAVDEALEEISRRVESKMICSCLPEELRNELKPPVITNAGIKEGVTAPPLGGVDIELVNEFDPPVFLDYMKELACSLSIDSRLKFSLFCAQLSAFFCSKGLGRILELQIVDDKQETGDTDSVHLVKESSPTPMEEDWLSGPGSPGSKNGKSSSLKRPQISQDKLYQRKKKRSLAELMAEKENSGDSGDEIEKKDTVVDKKASSSKKAKVVKHSISPKNKQSGNRSITPKNKQSGNKSITPKNKQSGNKSMTSVKNADYPEETPKRLGVTRVGQSLSKIASQLTGTPPILKCSGETFQKTVDKVGRGRPKGSSSASLMSPKENKKTPKENQSTPKENQRTPKENQRTSKENQRTPKENQRTPKENQRTPKENQKTLKESEKTPKEKKRTPKENQKTLKESEKTPKQKKRTPKENKRTPKSSERSASPKSILSEICLAAINPPLYYKENRSSCQTISDFFANFRSSQYLHDPESGSAGRKRASSGSKDSISSPEGYYGGKRRMSKEEAWFYGPKKKTKRSAMEPPSPLRIENKETQKDSPAALIISFARGFNLPSQTDLVGIFSKFGPLKESETEVSKDSGCARLVFERSSDAEAALNSSSKSSVFGSAVVSYRVRYMALAHKNVENNGTSQDPTLVGGNIEEPISSMTVEIKGNSVGPPLKGVEKGDNASLKLAEENGKDEGNLSKNASDGVKGVESISSKTGEIKGNSVDLALQGGDREDMVSLKTGEGNGDFTGPR
ncbi:uncharacterized protein LOC18434896 [Amborella trichopoda]|uniref:PWWP domain-containing protein n=1 Tax=Amborella trichopoda TaxID=13333 RepID=W1PHY4_AMBTC|nr:uncharacterized protein LOC18434896 [Amborella trichopoda]ERN06695.1 hypothetical protein AMTR_s00058p00210830 [Amborella trichopoda]|eukprot:XP_006845020.1 uncharacterized protein LOC18434896 [Amborella trichopoda]